MEPTVLELAASIRGVPNEDGTPGTDFVVFGSSKGMTVRYQYKAWQNMGEPLKVGVTISAR